MNNYIKQGWSLSIKHFHLVILLFLYQLLWGIVVYRFVDSVVAPLLRRFPSGYPSEAAMSHFLAEAQFQLMKTDLISPYLWMLAGLFAARMLLSPLINAGLLHSMHHQSRSGEGTRFLEGIRRNWKPFILLYWGEAILSLSPGAWLLPKALDAFQQSASIASLLQKVLPGAGLWVIWVCILHLLFLAAQYGVTSQEGILQPLWRGIRHFASYAALSVIMWGISSAFSMVTASVSLLWAGLFALIIHQGYHLLRSLMKVWTLAAQFEYLQSKQA